MRMTSLPVGRDAVPVNQAFTLQVFLSSQLPRLSEAVKSLASGDHTSLHRPGRVVDVLASALEGRNAVTASKLAQFGLALATTFRILVGVLSEKVGAGPNHGQEDSMLELFLDERDEDFHTDMPLVTSYVKLLSLQLKVSGKVANCSWILSSWNVPGTSNEPTAIRISRIVGTPQLLPTIHCIPLQQPR